MVYFNNNSTFLKESSNLSINGNMIFDGYISNINLSSIEINGEGILSFNGNMKTYISSSSILLSSINGDIIANSNSFTQFINSNIQIENGLMKLNDNSIFDINTNSYIQISSSLEIENESSVLMNNSDLLINGTIEMNNCEFLIYESNIIIGNENNNNDDILSKINQNNNSILSGSFISIDIINGYWENNHNSLLNLLSSNILIEGNGYFNINNESISNFTNTNIIINGNVNFEGKYGSIISSNLNINNGYLTFGNNMENILLNSNIILENIGNIIANNQSKTILNNNSYINITNGLLNLKDESIIECKNNSYIDISSSLFINDKSLLNMTIARQHLKFSPLDF